MWRARFLLWLKPWVSSRKTLMNFLKRIFKKKDKQRFSTNRFKKIINNAIKFLEESPAHSLSFPKFQGTGVYALYYEGDFPLYVELNAETPSICTNPIYVGKAVPSGWRTARIRSDKSTNLHKRLKEHVNSIVQAKNLKINDFTCKFILLESDLISPVEAELIRRYQPLWNSVVDGFGNHNVGKTRYDQAKSEWDILHSGRVWAENMRGESLSYDQLVDKIKKTLQG